MGEYCLCRGDDVGKMIGCDGKDCGFNCPGNGWFHFECVGISDDPAGKNQNWYCESCRAQKALALRQGGRRMNGTKRPRNTRKRTQSAAGGESRAAPVKQPPAKKMSKREANGVAASSQPYSSSPSSMAGPSQAKSTAPPSLFEKLKAEAKKDAQAAACDVFKRAAPESVPADAFKEADKSMKKLRDSIETKCKSHGIQKMTKVEALQFIVEQYFDEAKIEYVERQIEKEKKMAAEIEARNKQIANAIHKGCAENLAKSSQLDRLRKELAAIKGGRICFRCEQAPWEFVLPCGHLACADCARALKNKKCCRKKASKAVKVYGLPEM